MICRGLIGKIIGIGGVGGVCSGKQDDQHIMMKFKRKLLLGVARLVTAGLLNRSLFHNSFYLSNAYNEVQKSESRCKF